MPTAPFSEYSSILATRLLSYLSDGQMACFLYIKKSVMKDLLNDCALNP